MKEDREEITEQEKKDIGEISVKKNKTIDLIAKIGCLILAFIIWFTVVSFENTDVDTTFKSVPVQILGENSLSVLSGTGSLVDITVSGKRSIIGNLTEDDVTAYVDITDIKSAGSYKLEIKTDIPDGVKVSEKSVENVSVYLDNTISKSVPVQIKLTNYMLEDGYQLNENEATSDPSEIIVTGPEKALDNISCARITLDLGRVTKSVTYNGGVTLIDNSGNEVRNNYVRMQNNQTTVSVPVYKYADVPLGVVGMYGYFNDTNSVLTITPQTIRVRGEAEAVDNLDLVFSVDEKKTEGNSSYKIGISLPDGIENVENVTEANVSVRLIGTSVRTVNVTAFDETNPNNVRYTVISPSLSVKVRGGASSVSRMTANDIKAVIDLSGVTQTSGTVIVPASIVFSDDFSGEVYELGEYTVSVRIAQNADNS